VPLDLVLHSTSRVAKKSAKKTAVSEPKSVSIVVSLVTVVLVSVVVEVTGSGMEVVVRVLKLVSVTVE
jgi:hypothetical protein